ncbi:hypothetical protein OJF2_27430 [Aquisphaera giovannonii]|uniref:DAC domain-containing protein n=1 Tax=Aquisphaera giovannonii TaxID=406548 RepID=A0A5B9W123_9BACT|nr:hypothetical protein [Aquisphaera giovannonii]QEH34208.1 hypothetical protein OJF2_27430 [Aquisphaera giovannonii]
MTLPIQPAAARPAGHAPGSGLLQDPGQFIDVFLGGFRRDLLSFYPGCRLDREPALLLAGGAVAAPRIAEHGELSLDFAIEEAGDGPADSLRVSFFGGHYRITLPPHRSFWARDREFIRAMGRVIDLYFRALFRSSEISLLQLRRGMPEDHYVAASVDPAPYASPSPTPGRIAEAILTLRTMALSTYENRRVATGALILASGMPCPRRPTGGPSQEALRFGVEITALRSLHRLCDGRRTLYLVDDRGFLIDVVDIRRWAVEEALAGGDRPLRLAGGPAAGSPQEPAGDVEAPAHEPLLPVPCPRAYRYHALATRDTGHICLVLSPNQEIKVLAGGVQAFVFAHGRWRVQDPAGSFAGWSRAVDNPALARTLFQAALDLAEERQGGLLVVVHDPAQAVGRLIAVQDLLDDHPARGGDDLQDEAESPSRPFTLFGWTGEQDAEPADVQRPKRAGSPGPGGPLSKRSIHYLAQDANVVALDPAVLRALASIDGALVADASGRLLAFGAILRHDACGVEGEDGGDATPAVAEGARTTAAIVASRFGPVLKVSEDGIISCYLDGARVWDL